MAADWLAANRDELITTDYVVDELLTLLRARGEKILALRVGDSILWGQICKIEWIEPADFDLAWTIFSAYRDKAWSFTDCVSRVVISGSSVAAANHSL